MATLLLNIPALSMVCAWERHLAHSTGWAGRQDFPFQQQCKLKFAPAGLETTLPLESTLGTAPATWEPTGSHCHSLQGSLSILGPAFHMTPNTQPNLGAPCNSSLLLVAHPSSLIHEPEAVCKLLPASSLLLQTAGTEQRYQQIKPCWWSRQTSLLQLTHCLTQAVQRGLLLLQALVSHSSAESKPELRLYKFKQQKGK